jgi:N,N'-diacetyllegionaminate synthase
MKIGTHDLSKKVLIVAEIGNNHEGSFALAEELVGVAAEAGASAVKFQTFRTEHYVSDRDAARFDRLKGFELNDSQFAKLADQAREAGMAFVSTPFDLRSASFLGEIADAIKISSGDNAFYPLIESAARSGKPLLFSTGLADSRVIRAAAGCIDRVWTAQGFNPGYAVLHCISSYPTPPDAANLAAISQIQGLLPDAVVGYSDHTLGIDAAALAVAFGARVIEKHFTIRKDYSDFRDHQLSADPTELKALVARIAEYQALIGDGQLSVAECEEPVSVAIRRSIVTTRAVSAGHVLSPADITWIRPGGGIPPGSESQVLGRVVKADLPAGEMILPEHLGATT